MKDHSASITGEITLDGKPAAGLEVALWPKCYLSQPDAIAIGKTDSTGRYLFAGLPMGRYWLKVDAPGYFDPFNWDEDGPGRNISVADGEFVVNADLHLTLGAVIEGRVTDPDWQPVVGQFVELIKLDKLGPLDERFYLPGEEGDFFTDSNGEYRIYGIPPGRYLVSIGVDVDRVTGAKSYPGYFHGTGQVDGNQYFEQAFHPGTKNRSGAAIIDVSAGAILRDVNISAGRSIRAYTATGRVIHDETRTPIRHCFLELGFYTGRGWPSSYMMGGPSDTDENGNFRVEGLLPGRFFISAQFEDETELYCTPVEFEINNEDLDGLEVKAHWGQELRGLVVIEGAQTQEARKRLVQLKLRADSIGHDSKSCSVRDEGRFVIRGLRPGPVNLSLGFEQTSKYFSILRIEYPDDAGETSSIFPTRTSIWPKLPSFCPPALPNPSPLLTPTPPNAIPPLPPASPNALTSLPPANGNALPLLPAPSPAPSRESRRLPPMPSHVPLRPRTTTPLSPELRPLPPVQLNEFTGTITVAGPQSSHPVPAPIGSPQTAPITGAAEPLGPRFPWDLPPLPLSEHGLSGVRLVVSYKNGIIRGHVSFKGENPHHDRPLHAGISHRTEGGGCWSTSIEIDPNGDFFIDGLSPGEYQLSILSETKTIVVHKDSETSVSFEIDLNAESNRDYFASVCR